jgi:hypothetical protein
MEHFFKILMVASGALSFFMFTVYCLISTVADSELKRRYLKYVTRVGFVFDFVFVVSLGVVLAQTL